ncbi:hypothetical protein K458DRAFT_409413 [Lentithecium fluviatile CBS 122367]|uniref:Uncharacterized protein n=1 Tax=Lentithecium fluviatile CBS 122367 TaxID=1168545 RepID=A0A6G1IHV1_9PLEO|nr:hypothetical protein K458DRAFT_409413 [Lentithecium fluviatile CBS 122367]
MIATAVAWLARSRTESGSVARAVRCVPRRPGRYFGICLLSGPTQQQQQQQQQPPPPPPPPPPLPPSPLSAGVHLGGLRNMQRCSQRLHDKPPTAATELFSAGKVVGALGTSTSSGPMALRGRRLKLCTPTANNTTSRTSSGTDGAGPASSTHRRSQPTRRRKDPLFKLYARHLPPPASQCRRLAGRAPRAAAEDGAVADLNLVITCGNNP